MPDQAGAAVVRAIKDEGAHPAYHREVMARHRKEWPALWRALDALVRGNADVERPTFTVEVWPRSASGGDPAAQYDADVVDVVKIDGRTHLVVVIDD